MIPAFLMMGFGGKRRIVVPLPFFLFWPLVGIVYLGVLIAQGIAAAAGRKPAPLVAARTALAVCSQLSGLRIDVRSREGSFYLRFV